MRVLSIVARHGTERYPSALEELSAIFARQLPQVTRTVVVVDNARPRATVERLDAATTVIGGDTALREFSAWDEALRHVGPGLADFELVHFATAAFNTLYTNYLRRFTPAVLEAAVRGRACVGHIDYYNAAVRLGPFTSRHWLRTACFVLPPSELALLGSMAGYSDRDALFSGDPAAPFRPDAPLCRTYQHYIAGWLRGSDIGQGVRWHSGFSLDRTNLLEFEQKALAIINEHLLAIRLRGQGCPLVDVTWLDTVGTTGEPDLHTPWTTQLAQRDEAAVVVDDGDGGVP